MISSDGKTLAKTWKSAKIQFVLIEISYLRNLHSQETPHSLAVVWPSYYSWGNICNIANKREG